MGRMFKPPCRWQGRPVGRKWEYPTESKAQFPLAVGNQTSMCAAVCLRRFPNSGATTPILFGAGKPSSPMRETNSQPYSKHFIGRTAFRRCTSSDCQPEKHPLSSFNSGVGCRGRYCSTFSADSEFRDLGELWVSPYHSSVTLPQPCSV
jgi:hypothetical protein